MAELQKHYLAPMGIRNNYRKGMPFFEIILKDFIHLTLAVKHYIVGGFKTNNIYILPDYPSKKTSIFKAAKTLNYNLSNKRPKNAKLYISWNDETFHNPEKHLFTNNNQFILNNKCTDISKEKVDSLFKSVFNYSTFIDPQTFTGKAVEKSDLNALHDGEVLQFPIKNTEPGKIYQILIDNSISDEEVVDLRVPVVKTTLKFIYLKYKKKNIRFDNITYHVEKVPIEDYLSKEEIVLIDKFCIEIKLDYGELDILRDNGSKKIYIIDVNKTPYGPPEGLNKLDSKIAINEIAAVLKELFL